MQRIVFFLLVLGGLALPFAGLGQCPNPDFTIPSTVCTGESFQVVNTSANSFSYEWDFCSGDLESTPSVTRSISRSLFYKPSHVTMVQDEATWRGFVVSRFGKRIVRLDYTDLEQEPSYVDLGTFNNAFTGQPIDIEFYKENGVWYALLIDAVANKLWRLVFGSLQNTTPTLESLDVFNSLALMSTPYDLELIKEEGNIVALISNYNGAKITRAIFGTSITNAPSGDNIVVSGAVNLVGISSIKVCSTWYAVATSSGNSRMYLLTYNSGLNATPGIAQMTMPAGVTLSAPVGVDLVSDNSIVYAFVQSAAGVIHKLSQANTSTPGGSSLGNFSGISSANEGVTMIKNGSQWYASLVNIDNEKITTIKFPFACGTTSVLSETQSPMLTYQEPGVYSITLKAVDNTASKNSKTISRTITVRSNIAPTLDINMENISCVSTSNVLTANATGNSSIVSYTWDFGDGNNATGQQVTHPFLNDGEYRVSLNVISSDGCGNMTSGDIKIYSQPVATFSIPSGIICTNNEITFPNTTTDVYDGNLSYQWYLDNSPAGTNRDLRYTFETTGVKTIKLVASVPGCSDENIQVTSHLQSGPAIDFETVGKCEDSEILFNSQLPLDITSYVWSFPEAGAIVEPNPGIVFQNAGEYAVSLSATNQIGCNTVRTKPVVIYSKPHPDFIVDAPPQSCTGTITPFQNTTSPPPDSDVTFWRWNFGDQNSSANILETESGAHLYLSAGNYTVELKAKTDQGCEGVIQKQIAIAQAPSAEFTNTSTCLGVSSTLTSTGADINSYYWETGTAYYTTKTIHHTFTSIGEQNVKLSVTGNNNCNTTITRKLTVPVPLTPSFSVWKNCVGYEAEFKDNTSGADAVAWRQWNIGGAITENTEQVKYTPSKAEPLATTLTIKGTSGCTYSKREDVSIWKAPVSKFTATPASGAIPLQVEVDNTSEEASRFRWTFNDGTVTNSEEAEPTYSFNTIGEHSIELKASNNVGCESVSSKIIDAQTPAPDVEINLITLSQNPDKTLKVIITLRNNGNTIIRNLPVRIDLSGQLLLNETVEGPLDPDQQYNLVLGYGISKNQDLDFLCAETKLESDISTGGNRSCIQLEKTSLIMSPYPNPATDVLNIEWIAAEAHKVSIMITDGFGKALLQKNIDATSGLNQHYFDVNDLKAGIYFLVINDGFTVKTQRILISPKN